MNNIFKGLDIDGIIVEKPIIQGGMGIGISLSRLAAAVAREGGMGIISAAQPGYCEPDFYSNPVAINIRALAEHIKKAKKESRGGAIGVNIMCVNKDFGDYATCCVQNGADLIISGAGLPVSLPEYVAGSNTKIAPIISSAKAAKVLLKLWDKRYSRTADLIVVEGKSAGGHLGFSIAELSEADNEGDLLEIIAIKNLYEEKYNRKIPIVFGGGVFDKSDLEHYVELGFDGVQVATRFIVTEECDVNDNFKERYLNLKKEDIVIVNSPVGLPGRAINNDFVKKTLLGRIPVERCTSCIDKCNPKETAYCITQALINAAKGDCDDGLMFCGGEGYRLNEATTVKKVMQDLLG